MRCLEQGHNETQVLHHAVTNVSELVQQDAFENLLADRQGSGTNVVLVDGLAVVHVRIGTGKIGRKFGRHVNPRALLRLHFDSEYRVFRVGDVPNIKRPNLFAVLARAVSQLMHGDRLVRLSRVRNCNHQIRRDWAICCLGSTGPPFPINAHHGLIDSKR